MLRSRPSYLLSKAKRHCLYRMLCNRHSYHMPDFVFLEIGFSRSSAPRTLVVSLLVNDVYFRGPNLSRELLSTRKSNACGCHWRGGIVTGISRKFCMPLSNVPRHLSASPIHLYRTPKPTTYIAFVVFWVVYTPGNAGLILSEDHHTSSITSMPRVQALPRNACRYQEKRH
jgi:hypothetical protein